MVPLVLPSVWRSWLGCRRSVPSPRVSGLASLTFQGSVLITNLCAIQRLSFMCPLKSVLLWIEYCKYLLGQEAGIPFCLGLAGTWIPLLTWIKTCFGRLKGVYFVGVVQAAFLGMKVWISMNRRLPECDSLCHRWVLRCMDPPIPILVLVVCVRFDGPESISFFCWSLGSNKLLVLCTLGFWMS